MLLMIKNARIEDSILVTRPTGGGTDQEKSWSMNAHQEKQIIEGWMD